jgi:hypothetical protein
MIKILGLHLESLGDTGQGPEVLVRGYPEGLFSSLSIGITAT